jgi:hypothetical protein
MASHMRSFHVTLAAGVLLVGVGSIAPAHSSQDIPRSAPAPANSTGLHDFDFLLGEWRVHHRRVPADGREWVEFDGTCSHRNLMAGLANMDEYLLEAPAGAYRAVALRSYDAKTGQWAIWWLDGRHPSGPLDPPVKGRFENGVGTFHSEHALNGKPMRVRFIWSHITPTSARWEQALSADAGKTWETNWIMTFQRSS